MVPKYGPRLRPWEIRKCTLAELALLLDQAEERKPTPINGAGPMSRAETMREVERWRALSMRERLREAISTFEAT